MIDACDLELPSWATRRRCWLLRVVEQEAFAQAVIRVTMGVWGESAGCGRCRARARGQGHSALS